MTTCIENFRKKYINKYGEPIHPDWEIMAILMCKSGFSSDEILQFILTCRAKLILKKLKKKNLTTDSKIFNEIISRLENNEDDTEIENDITNRLELSKNQNTGTTNSSSKGPI